METTTFTLYEKEKGLYNWSDYHEIRYCSYCGQKAKRADQGGSHNNRWEEEIVYSCNCDTAKKEISLKEETATYKNKIRALEKELKDMERLIDNSVVNKMKFDKELETLKAKFKIN